MYQLRHPRAWNRLALILSIISSNLYTSSLVAEDFPDIRAGLFGQAWGSKPLAILESFDDEFYLARQGQCLGIDVNSKRDLRSATNGSGKFFGLSMHEITFDFDDSNLLNEILISFRYKYYTDGNETETLELTRERLLKALSARYPRYKVNPPPKQGVDTRFTSFEYDGEMTGRYVWEGIERKGEFRIDLIYDNDFLADTKEVFLLIKKQVESKNEKMTQSEVKADDLKKSLLVFLKSYQNAISGKNSQSWASHFLEGADYCYSDSKVSRDFLSTDRSKLIRKYNSRNYEFGGASYSSLSGGAVKLTNPYQFTYRKPNKVVSGKTIETLHLKREGSTWRIAEFDEKVEVD